MRIEVIQNILVLSWDRPQRILASALLNGGLVEARYVVNAQVDRSLKADAETASQYLGRQACAIGIQERVVGMMTAAEVRKYGYSRSCKAGFCVETAATVGTSNALRAGDTASTGDGAAGTVNLVVGCSATMPDSALVEAAMIAGEAKAAVFAELDIRSVVSGLPATGTGTDAIVIASGPGKYTPYCGKHLVVGELIARSVMEAIRTSYAAYRPKRERGLRIPRGK